MGEAPKQRVAVIGSGMAGLVAAFLVQRDTKCRYKVEVFEKQDQLSLDSASYSLGTAADDGDSLSYRVDIPMRAFDNNYHINLKRMYDYLGIDYVSPKFLYSLSRFSPSTGKRERPYFIHSSSNHRVPPIRPRSRGRAEWVAETLYLMICYFWFTVCCFLVRPRGTNKSCEEESLQRYLKRIRLPSYFSRRYLLPLLSSMTTCSHNELLNFPAADVVDYAKRTYRQPHYTVVGGVQRVQSRISEGLVVRLSSTVTAVESIGTRCRITWTDSQGDNMSEEYDHVIMAVTPDVVSTIFKPLEKLLQSIPVVKGECIVHRDTSILPDGGLLAAEAQKARKQPEVMYMFSDDTSTESVHQHPLSVLVTNFPIAPVESSKIIHRARLTRVLRTPESRKVVNSIFSAGRSRHTPQEKEKLWCNGDGNVWLVGAWCWDGMVLLEGCVMSAMRVAACLDVDIPWLKKE